MKRLAKNKKVLILNFVLLIMLIIFIIPNVTGATIDPGAYKPNELNQGDVTMIQGKANPIIGTIKTVGIVIAVVTLITLGLKYMMGSVSEKAEYKKTMIPYLIGAVMIVGITQLLSILIDLITKMT